MLLETLSFHGGGAASHNVDAGDGISEYGAFINFTRSGIELHAQADIDVECIGGQLFKLSFVFFRVPAGKGRSRSYPL